MKKIVIVTGFLLLVINAFPQEIVVDSDTIRNNALNVYFPNVPDFIKKEISFINYVRDLKEADVYLVISEERTGSGGEITTAFFEGQNKYSDMRDTIKIYSSPDDTEEVTRAKAINAFKMGLMRYMLKTPLADYFDIRFTQPVKETIESDNWNNWVFRSSLSGSLNGEKSYQSKSISGNFTANRITEKSKLKTQLSGSWSQQKYELNDSTDKYSHTRSDGLYIYYARSINDHWSVGLSSGLSSSSYGNYDLRYRLAPAIEYDIYPYSESTRRQFRIMYEIGYQYNDYSDTTIYNKVTENLAFHSLYAYWETIQKWGSLDLTLGWYNYLHDWSKNNLSGNAYLSVRLFKGLNINFSGSASIVNDQLSLPKAGVSDFDIITRRRITETKFSYYGYFGFSYTFGSIYNNVVNPRFGW
jgi:hypothetical protein